MCIGFGYKNVYIVLICIYLHATYTMYILLGYNNAYLIYNYVI